MQKISLKFWLLLLCSILTVATYGQSANGGKKIPIATALTDITKRYSTHFVFEPDLIKGQFTSISVTDLPKSTPLEEVMKRIFYPANLLFVYVNENTYMLIQRPVSGSPKELAVAVAAQLPRQEGGQFVDATEISGFVLDSASREPLPGVTVRSVNGSHGGLTDNSGRFILRNVAADSRPLEVVVSMVGYRPKRVSLHGQVTSIALSQNVNTLDEVKVVEIGYGSKRKEALTNAVGTVNNKTITQMPTPMLSNALVGTIPGLFGRQTGGSPGRDASRLLVRSSSFVNPALIVIDGVPLNDNISTGGFAGQASINDLDPADIESVTVLKDAASTAIYGSRGGNGVILITTKRGKKGKSAFNFTANSTWSQPTQQPKFVDAYQQALLENEFSVNSNKGIVYSDATLDTIRLGLNPDKFANTNWRKAALKDWAKGQNYNLNVSGGNEAVKYYVAGGYNNQGSLVSDNAFKRYTLISNLDAKVNRNLTMGVDIRYVNEQLNDPAAIGANGILNNVYLASPLQPVYFSNGLPAANYTGTITNPVVQESNSGYYRKTGNYFNGKLKLDYNIPFVKGLTAHAMASFDRNNYGDKTFATPYKLYRQNASGQYIPVAGVDSKGADLKPTLSENLYRANYTNTEWGFNYDRTFGLHRVSGMLLYTTNESNTSTLSAARSNIFSSSIDQLFAGDASTNSTNNGTASEFGRVGYVGRASYSYNGKYYVDASFRSEASVNYPDGHRWGTFPSVSASWRMSEENFIKDNITWIDELKIRASYGMAGDETGSGYGSYLYNFSVGQNSGPSSTTGRNGYVFGGSYVPSVYPGNTAPNLNITWGTIKAANFGMNVSLFKGLLGAEFDVYRKNNTNILISVSDNVPLSYGASTPKVNRGSNHTTGYELSLTHNNHISKDFSYYVRGTISHTKTITDYSGEQSGLPAWDTRQVNGWGANIARVYHAVGLFQSREEIDNWAVQDGRNNTTINPGDIKYADLNGDHIIDQKDVIVKDNTAIPLLNYGISLGATWKKLSLDVTFQGIGDYTNTNLGKSWTNYDSRQLDRWTPENTDATWPKLGSIASDIRISDFYGLNSNYLRLRNVRLAYTLAPLWLKKAGINNVVINMQGGNLLVFSRVKFTDPENDNTTPYGPQKTLSAGVNVSF
ncbi:TonB-linked outer membrane protein, SusC/RagA family [Chitinophaga jiangningensis]|uniref:TonB-linked outer membrane protein, SusC/RagA family n=1 Tax=Chitinophaga jiangningensis TaxID=1419482 RepID=A0A1M6YV99_9BACT|nr:TonB-dependent receptor [Chitinophaga jiangningensis]SHL22196.1 TonB-linked outer membrane protein, SusC/RagA family [Chitinophaga jiangningensis]